MPTGIETAAMSHHTCCPASSQVCFVAARGRHCKRSRWQPCAEADFPLHGPPGGATGRVDGPPSRGFAPRLHGPLTTCSSLYLTCPASRGCFHVSSNRKLPNNGWSLVTRRVSSTQNVCMALLTFSRNVTSWNRKEHNFVEALDHDPISTIYCQQMSALQFSISITTYFH